MSGCGSTSFSALQWRDKSKRMAASLGLPALLYNKSRKKISFLPGFEMSCLMNEGKSDSRILCLGILGHCSAVECLPTTLGPGSSLDPYIGDWYQQWRGLNYSWELFVKIMFLSEIEPKTRGGNKACGKKCGLITTLSILITLHS